MLLLLNELEGKKSIKQVTRRCVTIFPSCTFFCACVTNLSGTGNGCYSLAFVSPDILTLEWNMVAWDKRIWCSHSESRHTGSWKHCHKSWIASKVLCPFFFFFFFSIFIRTSVTSLHPWKQDSRHCIWEIHSQEDTHFRFAEKIP